MPAPTKKWVDPNQRPEQLGLNGNLLIAPAALRGLVAALMAQWKLPPGELEKLFPSVYALAVAPCDKRTHAQLGGKTEDEAAIEIAKGIKTAIDGLLRPCPTEMLRIQQQGLDEILRPFPYKHRSSVHARLWLQGRLPDILQRAARSSVCHPSRPHPTTLPSDDQLREWVDTATPAKLRNKILAYLHGMTYKHMAQLLAGRKQ